eukprot:g32668.t1
MPLVPFVARLWTWSQDLREIISFILHSANSPHDQAVVRIASPGGMVADYGLAAAQLLRLRSKGLKLTACVDKVAASGGYMQLGLLLMATPNFSKILKRNDIDFIQLTAGKWKRTVGPFSEDIRIVHEAFKGLVQEQRGGLNVDEVATGEVFLGAEAKSRGLVDRLATSDEVLDEFMGVSDVIQVSVAAKKKGVRELLEGRLEAAEVACGAFWQRLTGSGSVVLESSDPQIQ